MVDSARPPPPEAVLDATALSTRWGRVVVSLQTPQLRVSWLRVELRALPVSLAAEALEITCAAAEGGRLRAAALVHALVELLADPVHREARDALRAEARARRHFTLERLLRRPFVAKPSVEASREPSLLFVDDTDDVALTERDELRGSPDYGKGRPLTLGERKSIARNPPLDLLPRVLADPHPDVIRNVLASPRLTEDLLVRMITRRPGVAEALGEVARHPRWCQRPRVRLALVLNPATPTELSIANVALLRRHELVTVIETRALHPAVRAAAHERHERLPPIRRGQDGSMQ